MVHQKDQHIESLRLQRNPLTVPRQLEQARVKAAPVDDVHHDPQRPTAQSPHASGSAEGEASTISFRARVATALPSTGTSRFNPYRRTEPDARDDSLSGPSRTDVTAEDPPLRTRTGRLTSPPTGDPTTTSSPQPLHSFAKHQAANNGSVGTAQTTRQ